MDNQNSPAPRYTGDWHRIKDWPPLEELYPGRPILVYWETPAGVCFLESGYDYREGILYDELDEPITDSEILNLAIWSYWPDKL